MTITSQQYAVLCSDSYKDYPVGVFPPGKRPVFVDPDDGTRYEILEHVNNRKTGYQGTVYQRVDTGEIVVAHRGTEGSKALSDPGEFVKDLLRADGGMLLARTNLQAKDAIALTERATAYAEDYGQEKGRTPKVTVTGHSLGGTLAQITGYKFGLSGETFNAFGAVSLRGYDVPPGGDRMLNHVRVTDFVSAASTHYGQVREYATPSDISKLAVAGYAQNRFLDLLAPDRPVAVAVSSIDEHLMHAFLNQDKNGRPDRSLLADGKAQALAQENSRAVDGYREDIAEIRAMITNSVGLPFQGIDRAREFLEEKIQESMRRNYVPPHGAPGVMPQQMPPGFPMQGFRSGALDTQRDAPLPSLQAEPSAYVDRFLAAARSGDDSAFRHLTQAAASSPAGRELRQEAIAAVDLQEQQAQQHAQQRMLEQQQDGPARGMRMG